LNADNTAAARPGRAMNRCGGKDAMRLFALAIAMSLAALTTAWPETATPDKQNGRFIFNPVAGGVLRLDTQTGQVSGCSRLPAGPASWSPMSARRWRWRSSACRKKTRGLRASFWTVGPRPPGAPGPSPAKELKLPSDAELDKVISFLEQAWRRLIEMGRNVLKDVEKKN
jgi:hypothetical protein